MAGQILDMISSPVAVITTKFDNKINGMTAAWVAQASFNPTLIMVSIAPQRYTHQLIQKSKIFAVNMLADYQVDIGKHFGFTTGKKTDKFLEIGFESKKTGSPILKESFGYLDCKLLSAITAGDHTIFVGEVVEHFIHKDKRPLLFRSDDFF